MQKGRAAQTAFAGDIQTMINHVLNPEQLSQLFKLELSGDYRRCIELLEKIVSTSRCPETEDAAYELGAAHLRLAIYQLICGMREQHLVNMDKAVSSLPKTDLFALAAIWLDRTGSQREMVAQYCRDFFDVVSEDNNNRDEVSQDYFETMCELRERNKSM